MDHVFTRIIEPHLNDIKKYCRMVAPTPWDADDLFQETMVKVHRHSYAFESAENVKSYLFRTVTNTWIDLCRKHKILFEPYEDDYAEITASDYIDPFEIEDALEQLVCQLPPLQCVVFLLNDVFNFTSQETANMIHSNENAVKSALFRARKNVRSLSLKEKNHKDSNPSLLETFILAFQTNDPFVIGRAYQALASEGFSVERNLSCGKPYFVVIDPDGNRFIVS